MYLPVPCRIGHVDPEHLPLIRSAGQLLLIVVHRAGRVEMIDVSSQFVTGGFRYELLYGGKEFSILFPTVGDIARITAVHYNLGLSGALPNYLPFSQDWIKHSNKSYARILHNYGATRCDLTKSQILRLRCSYCSPDRI